MEMAWEVKILIMMYIEHNNTSLGTQYTCPVRSRSLLCAHDTKVLCAKVGLLSERPKKDDRNVAGKNEEYWKTHTEA